jgi:hydrogenase expression/formation protein HypE
MAGDASFDCPVPDDPTQKVSMAHGGGGRLMHRLIDEYLRPLYRDERFSGHDAAVLDAPPDRLAMTTDSYVVDPIFFPGGDIGKLAVCGTINDLAMAGAKPLYLSLALVIEEGFALADLGRILRSIRESADAAGVRIVTGDTKVVERGKGDRLYINTTGIGAVPAGLAIGPERIAAGDAILVNGDLGRHAVAIMSSRDAGHAGLQADVGIVSDVMSLAPAVRGLLDRGIDVHCLRDLTRGGLASALNELAGTAALHASLDESSVPVHAAVAAYCEILGLEPHYLANEGRFVCIVPEAQAALALESLGPNAARIGSFRADRRPGVSLRTPWGSERLLPMLSGEQLPRIC